MATDPELFMEAFSNAYEKKLEELVKEGRVPEHVAIIMDGNRRFAKSRGEEPLEGHQHGKERLKELLEWCRDIDIRVLTVYAFSTENFNRDMEEVEGLMEMFIDNFRELAENEEKLMEYGVKVKVLGELGLLPGDVLDAIRTVVERTANNDNYYFNLAIAYGGREEITSAVREIARDLSAGKIEKEDIDQELISSYLYTHELPDPDLILRTSGEIRLSNFLLWQMAYSEFYFSDVYWPGFDKTEFLRAIRAYQMRTRRFGE